MPWIHTLKSQLKDAPIQKPEPGPGTAAVLVLIGQRPQSSLEEILLTKRTHLVETHKGQVSFPGGYWQEGDEDSLQTALRECEEEIGLVPNHIEVIGALPMVQTRGAVPIFPWVAQARFPEELSVNESEVDRVLYLSMNTFLEKGVQPVTVEAPDYKIQSIGIRVSGELVWGATARVLKQLHVYLTAAR